MQLSDLLLLLLVAAFIAFWWYGAKNGDIAMMEARRLCRLDELQLLDYTVEQKRLRLGRNRSGSVCFCRQYIFEFTTTGEQRYQGRIEINGGKIVKSDLDVYRISDDNLSDL